MNWLTGEGVHGQLDSSLSKSVRPTLMNALGYGLVAFPAPLGQKMYWEFGGVFNSSNRVLTTSVEELLK